MSVSNPILQGAQHLAQGNIAAAEQIAHALLAPGPDADALHLLALVRIQQQRLDEAIQLLGASLSIRPHHAQVLLNLGKVLLLAGRHGEAAAAMADAVAADPGLADAWYELGELQHRLGDPASAEASWRRVLALVPGHQLALLSLGVLLKDNDRPAESEALLAQGFGDAQDPRLKAAFAYNLAFAQYGQGKKDAALENFARVARLDPGRSSVELTRAELLAELSRFDEALAVMKDMIAREPLNPAAHQAYNDLLHALGRDEEFLASYDKAPDHTPLALSKAGLLSLSRRTKEAHEAYAAVLAREPDNRDALSGAAEALAQLGHHDEAVKTLEKALANAPHDPGLIRGLAIASLQNRDPEKAAAMAEKCVARAPHDQLGLAVLGSAWRMMDDARDERLNGYDELIQLFDLEAPRGFSDMAAFNAELNAWLAQVHPHTREPINQSLRSGSQTRGNIFGAGHDLVERLKQRIAEAMQRYIAAIAPDAAHPFRGRGGAGFRFTGSWSSRLRDCGYHVNHVHPEGWISSCYYVGVPDAVKDETQKQGWIKFGEPSYDIGLGVRRAIQPVPGRLVLFPSYMWHGTVPFHSDTVRTTIAFDAIPR